MDKIIVKINRKRRYNYLVNFICRHFDRYIIRDNFIYIPNNNPNLLHKKILVEWIARHYLSKNSKVVSDIQKPIKIIFPTPILHTIKWVFLKDGKVILDIKPLNYNLIKKLEKFLDVKFGYRGKYFSSYIDMDNKVDNIENLLKKDRIFGVYCKHIYNKKRVQTNQNQHIYWAYQTLGAKPEDDRNIIKTLYKKLAFKYHPDIAGENYTKKFQLINEAYSQLLEYAS